MKSAIKRLIVFIGLNLGRRGFEWAKRQFAERGWLKGA